MDATYAMTFTIANKEGESFPCGGERIIAIP
jgi:hypothetical protein